MNFKKLFYKFKNKNKYNLIKFDLEKQKKLNIIQSGFEDEINTINKNINTKKVLNFLHSGHLGDVINALPVLKELSKNHTCNLFLQSKRKLEDSAKNYKFFGDSIYMTDKMVQMLLPLLKKQRYLNEVNFYTNQTIDVNLDLFRKIPMNFNLDEVRWYFYLTGVHTDLSQPYLNVEMNQVYKNKIVIMRSTRRKNNFINYKFINKYNNSLFLGLEEEFIDLKKEIPNLLFCDTKDFLEMAQIIKSSKFFIGNSSFGFTLAEALKVPRIMESYPDFPVIYPNGGHGYDIYFQTHFENICEKLNNI